MALKFKGIEKVAKRFCVQTAVYWGSPQNDGFGSFLFADPIEIKCRWEDKAEVNIGWLSTGYPSNLILSKASVMVLQDLDLQGYLYLGTIEELEEKYSDSSYLSKPFDIQGAYIIHRFDKIPMVRKTDEFVRIAWLYDQGK